MAMARQSTEQVWLEQRLADSSAKCRTCIHAGAWIGAVSNCEHPDNIENPDTDEALSIGVTDLTVCSKWEPCEETEATP